MSVTVAPEHRKEGLVYLDTALVDTPATHVMIIGAGIYNSPAIRNVTSPPVSAKAVADWFLGNGYSGFHNDDRPLGSLAMVISERDDGAATTYAGATLPRATFSHAKAAVGAWRRRGETHKDNMLVLYVCSHGESHGARTAFLLEDYGSDIDDVTAGMSEVEQFVRALERAAPVCQLLMFDCCRTPTAAALPFDEPFGNKLIGPVLNPEDHGEARQQWVIASTALGEEATGRKGKTTVFADSMLQALEGLAADPREGDWRITPATLASTIHRLLKLHQRSHAPPQTPNGRHANPFPICFARAPADVQTFITFDDPSHWPDCEINVFLNAAPHSTLLGRNAHPAFARLALPELATVKVAARTGGGTEFQTREVKLYPPSMFLELGSRSALTMSRGAGSHRGLGSQGGPESLGARQAGLAVSVSGSANLIDAVRVTVEPRSAVQQGRREERTLTINGSPSTFDLDTGCYRVSIVAPDGSTVVQDADVAAGETVDVRLELPSSPHEWMQTATAIGLAQPPEHGLSLAQIIAARTGSDALAAAGPHELLQRTQAAMLGEADQQAVRQWRLPDARHARSAGDGHDMTIERRELPDDRFLRFEIVDQRQQRLVTQGPVSEPANRLLWAMVNHPLAREMCPIPAIGNIGAWRQQMWQPSVLIDQLAAPGRALTNVVIESPHWAALLSYLAARDFESGGAVMSATLRDHAVRDAIVHKADNPLAATLSALIVVGCGAPERFGVQEQWLRNIANWFPGLPDGPIILGRHQWNRARTARELEDARGLFLEGYRRGPPAFALSLDWLARGLESFEDSTDPAAPVHAVRRFINRVDPTHAFTVIQLDART